MFRYGRINRATYWLGLALIAGVYTAIYAITSKPVHIAEMALIVVAIPRLHDIGKSAWWAGAALLAEIAVVVLALVLLPMDTALIPMGLFTLLLLGLMIWLGAAKGHAEANDYGEPPSPGLSMSFGKSKAGP